MLLLTLHNFQKINYFLILLFGWLDLRANLISILLECVSPIGKEVNANTTQYDCEADLKIAVQLAWNITRSWLC